MKQIQATGNDEFGVPDNQHSQYINKLPYFKKIYGKSKLLLKAYSSPRKGHWVWSIKIATMSFKI